MPHTDYIAKDDQGKSLQLSRFTTNIIAQFPALGLTATDPGIIQQAKDAIRFRALVEFGGVMQSSAQAWTASKNHERDGGDTTPSGQTVPVLPVDFPDAVAPGIIPRFRALAQQIKACAGYTLAIGQMLGIEGTQGQISSEMATDGPQPYGNMSATLSLVVSG